MLLTLERDGKPVQVEVTLPSPRQPEADPWGTTPMLLWPKARLVYSSDGFDRDGCAHNIGSDVEVECAHNIPQDPGPLNCRSTARS
jgi:hypothetical protein